MEILDLKIVTTSFLGDIIWGSIPHRTEFQGSAVTVDFLDSVTSELFRLGLGASDC